jgi:nucleoid DNA-binding protein
MTKADFVKVLKEKAGLSTLAQAEAALENVFAIIKESLKKGDAIAVSGFGSFMYRPALGVKDFLS